MQVSALRCVLLSIAASVAASSAQAGSIEVDTWYQFSFQSVGDPVRGCDPADPAGDFCIPSSGTPTVFLDAPAWTFIAPAEGVSLVVVDAFLSGERFEIFDGGISLGLTSEPGAATDCGDDPLVCLADTSMSRGSFAFAAGPDSLTLALAAGEQTGGSAYLLLVPEPGTGLLLVSGLVVLAIAARPRRPGRRAPRSLLALAFAGAASLGSSCDVGGIAPGATSSQPIALSTDDAFLAVANPDNDSVIFFDVRGDRNRFLAEVPVQTEPNGVAFHPNGHKVYVANTVSGTVSVIPFNAANGSIGKPSRHIVVGAEPYGLALTPNGSRLYVTNARSNSISVIDTASDTLLRTRSTNVPEPRGLAITNDGDADDLDERVYVTHFLARNIPGKVDGQDDAKEGVVSVLRVLDDLLLGVVPIHPIADTGFKANGDALARIAPGMDFTFTTGAYPNQLNNIAIHGGFAYLPNTGASPNGPVRFDVNTQSLLSVVNTGLDQDAGLTLNMHLAVQNQSNPAKRFITQPWAMAFEHAGDTGWVVSAASNILVKLALDPSTGAASVQVDPSDPSKVLQIPLGKNPRGIVINSIDTRAYVANYVSRDVTVVDLTSSPEAVHATLPTAALPTPGTLADQIHVGRELYHTSVGEFDPPLPGDPPVVGRMSNNGWGACSTCHPFGLSDNVVWIFGSGPRRTISQHTDFDLVDPLRLSQRPLNWSAERDEEEDFELNIRGVSGGQGLIVLPDGVTQDPAVSNLVPLANGGRNQLEVRGIPAWDGLKSFVQFGIRPPISPASKLDPDVIAGRALFQAANCQQCHGGPQWTRAKIRFTPPPATSQIVGTQLIGELRQVGTFDPTFFNEVRANATAPLGADGFVPPSLLSVFAFPGNLFHNGAAPSVDVVLQNVTHRSAGTGGVDTLSNPSDRARVATFVLSIDAATTPIP